MATANISEQSVGTQSRSRPPAKSRFARLVSWVNPNWWPTLLIVSDMLLILFAFIGAYFLRYELQWFRAVDPAFAVSIEQYRPFLFALLIILPISFYFSDVYPYRCGRSLMEEIYSIATATTAGVVVMITASLFFRPLLFSRLIFLYTALLVTLLLGLSRLFILLARRHLRQYGIGIDRVLLVGAGDIGRMVMRNVTARPDFGYQLVGFVDDNPVKGNTDIGPFKALGPVENFEEILSTEQVDGVIICLPWQSHRTVQHLVRTCSRLGLRAQVVPDLFQLTRDQMQVDDLNGIPLISSRQVSIRGWNLVIKRATDLIFGSLLGLFTLPVTLAIALAVRLESPGPILYVQERIGKNGRPFKCFKFRSMVEGAEDLRPAIDELNESSGPLFKVRNDPRCTRVGRTLRRFSLDELPQLINVLRGEMSLVGPRPNLPAEVEQYHDWHKRRLAANPGITGLWQVSGRSDLTFDEMVLLDIYYVENWNLATDLGILLRTIPAVTRARGAY